MTHTINQDIEAIFKEVEEDRGFLIYVVAALYLFSALALLDGIGDCGAGDIGIGIWLAGAFFLFGTAAYLSYELADLSSKQLGMVAAVKFSPLVLADLQATLNRRQEGKINWHACRKVLKRQANINVEAAWKEKQEGERRLRKQFAEQILNQ